MVIAEVHNRRSATRSYDDQRRPITAQTFLVNVGSPTEATVEQSVASIAHNLARGAQLGCRGVVVHAGSAVGEDRYDDAVRQLHERLLPVLEAAPDGGPRLLVEPTAGGGRSLAATVEDLGPYFAALEHHPLLGVCFDTCHAWAAGHELTVPGGMAATLDALEATVGPGRLGLVHANDSLDECGSKRDRHTTIGAGSIGVAPFAELLTHRSVAGVPVVVETPSDDDGHARDIALLNDLAVRRTAPPSGTCIHGPPSVRAHAIGPIDGSASSQRRSALCRRRSSLLRPARAPCGSPTAGP